jgi:mannose-1-phosphate guanylyltransferase
LVLAAGEGSRLQSLTTTASGIAVPKQFCSLSGGASLLQDAIERARRVVQPDRICTVVAEHHEHWWQSLPQSIPARNIIVQPRNRGTAHGILLPLLQILGRDPEALLLVLPSDHYVRNEAVLGTSLREAVVHAGRHGDRIVLLGIAPEDADGELGYIVPAGEAGSSLREVSEFIEKPSTAVARTLMERGGLWNAFIFAARGRTLLRAFEARCPRTVAEMREVVASPGDDLTRRCELAALYERLSSLDFSRDILAQCPAQLQVLAVPKCGWSDLGTPRRIAEVVNRHNLTLHECDPEQTSAHRFVDLVARHLQAQASHSQELHP